jgi:hypothetical protein
VVNDTVAVVTSSDPAAAVDCGEEGTAAAGWVCVSLYREVLIWGDLLLTTFSGAGLLRMGRGDGGEDRPAGGSLLASGRGRGDDVGGLGGQGQHLRA